jgi:glycosyltransferase involved in cell wall biosynthesis
LPEIRFWVVGRDPGPRLAALARDPRVTLTGAVEDVRPYLARATVVIVPMRLGSGTRIKIMEALAMGKAVVSTRAGAEGLRVVPGRYLVVADDPAAFAAEVVRLARDPAERQRLGREGRALVEAEYDWRVVLAPMSQAVDEVAGRRLVGMWAR